MKKKELKEQIVNEEKHEGRYDWNEQEQKFNELKEGIVKFITLTDDDIKEINKRKKHYLLRNLDKTIMDYFDLEIKFITDMKCLYIERKESCKIESNKEKVRDDLLEILAYCDRIIDLIRLTRIGNQLDNFGVVEVFKPEIDEFSSFIKDVNLDNLLDKIIEFFKL